MPLGDDGIWPKGPHKGLNAHGNFQIDEPNLGINHRDSVISPPRFTLEKAIQIASDATARNQALSWNLAMYDDASVSPVSISLLSQLGSAIRTKYPKSVSEVTNCKGA